MAEAATLLPPVHLDGLEQPSLAQAIHYATLRLLDKAAFAQDVALQDPAVCQMPQEIPLLIAQRGCHGRYLRREDRLVFRGA